MRARAALAVAPYLLTTYLLTYYLHLNRNTNNGKVFSIYSGKWWLSPRPSSPAPPVLPLTASRGCARQASEDCDDCDCCEGGGGRRRSVCCGLSSFFVFIVLFAMSWDTLEPTDYGLVQNGFTGAVDLRAGSVYEGGRYFVWLVCMAPWGLRDLCLALAAPSQPPQSVTVCAPSPPCAPAAALLPRLP